MWLFPCLLVLQNKESTRRAVSLVPWTGRWVTGCWTNDTGTWPSCHDEKLSYSKKLPSCIRPWQLYWTCWSFFIPNRNKSVLLKMTVCHLKVLWWKHGVVSVYYCGAAIKRIGLKVLRHNNNNIKKNYIRYNILYQPQCHSTLHII